MKDLGAALSAGLRAPVRHVKLAGMLWLARLLPLVAVFGLPAFARLEARSAHHPDAGLLLEAEADQGAFAWSWTRDLFRTDMAGVDDTIFWTIVFSWIVVTFLAGGITARLVHGGTSSGLFLAECGRYAGRFVRLGLLVAALFYVLDLSVNTLLADVHAERAKAHHLQGYGVQKAAQRGLVFLAMVHVLGALHTYARIEIVSAERRSVVMAFVRAFGAMLIRFPKLVVLELVMLGATGAVALLAWLLLRVAAPVDAGSGWLTLGIFFGLAALASYFRTGVEVGVLEARCRVLAPPLTMTPPTESQKETLPSF